MEFFETLFSARAMRRYSGEPIPEDLLLRLLEAAHAGPSGSNRQSRHWIVVRDSAQKQRLAELNRRFVSRYLEANREAANPHVSPEKRRRFLAAVEHQMEHMHEVPAIVIACTEMAAAPRGTFAEGVQAATEVWGAVQNLLLAARALGIGSVPTTLGLVDRDAARAVLNLPDHILPMVLIPLGWPTGNFGPIRRRPLEEVLHWDRYDDSQAQPAPQSTALSSTD